MKLFKFLFSLLLLPMIGTLNLHGQEIVKLPILLKNDSIQWETKEEQFFSKAWNTEAVSNVIEPSMEVFRPEKPNGTAIVICPGGGLYALSIESEGNMVARWLAKRGVTAFVLRYRLVPTQKDATVQIGEEWQNVLTRAKPILPLAVSDGLQAINHIRTNASEYGIKKEQIGIIGFSAGGAVTMGVTYACKGENCPNFIGPVYAWMDVVDPQEMPKDAPPMFLVCASDDPLNLAPASIQLYNDWWNAKKEVELHMYAKGGHGFGMRTQNLPSDQWIERFGEWLQSKGWIE